MKEKSWKLLWFEWRKKNHLSSSLSRFPIQMMTTLQKTLAIPKLGKSINKLFTVSGFGKFHFCSEQITYQTCPKSHILNTSYMAENGRTMMPSIKSAQAKETIKRLVAPLSLEVILTAVMTMILPKMTMRQTRPRGNSEPITRASWKLTLSKGLLQFLIQKTSCCFDSKLLVASWCDSVELKLVVIADSSWETRPKLKIVHHKDQFSIDL